MATIDHSFLAQMRLVHGELKKQSRALLSCRTPPLFHEFAAATMEIMHHEPKVFKRWIACLLMVITIIDLLRNHGQTEQTEDLIEGHIDVVQAHLLTVVVDDFITREHAW